MQGLTHDHRSGGSHYRQPAAAKSNGGRRPAWRARGVVLLHLAPRPVRPRGQRSMDRQFHPACPLSALLHRRDARVPRVRLLVGLPILEARLRRWRGLRAPAAESNRQNKPHPRNHPRRRRARPRLHRAAVSQLMTGEFHMNKLIAHAAVAVGIIASPAVMAADRTVTLAVNNMDCAACPSIVKGSLEAVPGVAKVAVSYRDKTATVIYDDAKADVNQLTSATTKAGYPSAPKS